MSGLLRGYCWPCSSAAAFEPLWAITTPVTRMTPKKSCSGVISVLVRRASKRMAKAGMRYVSIERDDNVF